MLEQTSKLKFFIAITIGGIGAFGQAYLLHHELVDCLPYKIMDADFYRMIAKFGICLAPTIAIILGALFGLKRLWLTTITPVVLCPLLFAFIFKTISILRSELSSFDQATWHFDGKNSFVVAQEFFFYTLGLAITGLIIGGICTLIPSYFSKQKRLA